MSRARDRADGFAGGSNDVFHLNELTVSVDYSVPASVGALSVGPVTVASGVTVTVPSGSTWTVV